MEKEIQIDENEIKNIEESICAAKEQEDKIEKEKKIKKLGVNIDAPVKTKVKDKVPPATTKDEIKKCILDIKSELGEPLPKSTFFRKTKAQLQDELKRLTKKLEEKAINVELDKKRREELIRNPEKNPVAKSLYTLNATLCQAIEGISYAAKSKTMDVALFEGLSKEVDNNKNEFLHVLARICERHEDMIEQYLNPVVLYMILMTKTTTAVAYKNIQKKKEQLSNQSKNSKKNTND